jgi:hypothetical protein
VQRIVILFHEYQHPRRHHHYMVDACQGEWEKWGLKVSFTYGVKERPEADLLFSHIDLTRTPPEYVQFIESYPAAVNRNLHDISKRRISTHWIRDGENYSGPVILKTDANYGGRPEYWLDRFRRPWRARLRRKATPFLEYVLGQRYAWQNVMSKYPVYDSLADVPRGVARNPALIVERFLPEREGDLYFLRYYLCLGDKHRSTRVSSPSPFMKRSSCKLVGEDLPVPEQVLNLRRSLGLDYGKIDYVIHDGEVVILDVNRTPAVPGSQEANARAVGQLAGGIWSLLPGK